MKRALLLGILAAVFFSYPLALAQDADCPANLYCVEYENNILEFSLEDGTYQVLVTKEIMTRVTTLNDQTEENLVVLTSFAWNGTTFVLESESPPLPKQGYLKDANLGDTFVLIEEGT